MNEKISLWPTFLSFSSNLDTSTERLNLKYSYISGWNKLFALILQLRIYFELKYFWKWDLSRSIRFLFVNGRRTWNLYIYSIRTCLVCFWSKWSCNDFLLWNFKYDFCRISALISFYWIIFNKQFIHRACYNIYCELCIDVLTGRNLIFTLSAMWIANFYKKKTLPSCPK